MIKDFKNNRGILKCFGKRVFFVILIIIFTNCSNQQKPAKLITDWQFQSQREEIAPEHWIESEIQFNGEQTLALAGNGKMYANGSWTKTFEVVPGKYYEFITHFKVENVTQLDRSVLSQIIWQDENGKRLGFIEFPATKAIESKDGWYIIQQKYQIPGGAVKARIDLFYRWDAEGKVYFGGTSFKETDAIKPRLVRLGAIHYKPKNTSSSQENLEQFGEFINIAGEKKADIVCLPEGITVAGTGKTYIEVSETIPGPSTKFLGQLAKKHNMYIVAGIYEKEGPVVYNTAILLGRDGELQGKYRKVALPREEIDGGITPGENFPVFDTDFGKIGMMICWDVFFPEPARMLALNGAEVIFMPIWGGNLTLAKARSIENQIYLVSSTYGMKTGVFDKNGKIIVEGTEENPVVVVEVDLNQRNLIHFLGEMRNRIQRELPSSKAIKY
ncbi:MAG: carbon-nitrogen hydrolase family protein [Prolixibacteraceae bacterium]|jgi:predicted amidohydrolase|nr:carbon-nitrogen hydrolase family protein [Prolixibacteraceae bacterium]MBT6999052.1 carbon-nitrogen hydrolase family protein [Prolixibacteraceae bacterium]MBT7394449.1 carbon-nitrogen hydrolase family protein [Prolixibacteraceae bacterium]